MSNRPVDLLIEDILEAIEKAERYVEGLIKTDFAKDEKTADAVVRNLEIIGEATNHIPDDVRTKYPNIEWKKIVGLRNRIVHDYFGVDLEIIWTILKDDLPPFKEKLCSILSELGS